MVPIMEICRITDMMFAPDKKRSEASAKMTMKKINASKMPWLARNFRNLRGSKNLGNVRSLLMRDTHI
jgi:hypothetical protein